MYKDTYKSAIDKIKASEAFKEKAAEAMTQNTTVRSRSRVINKPLVAAAVSLVLVMGVSFLSWDNSPSGPVFLNPIVTPPTDGVYIPALTLPDEPGVEYDMIGLIVYKGKIYTESATYIDLESAKTWRGEKLGMTKDTLDEWSSQDDYAVEFASTVGVRNAYSVQGFNKDFRIMTIDEHRAVLYENLNDITVYSGEDVFGKIFNGQDLISLDYLSRYDHSVVYPIQNEALLHSFVAALLNSTPINYQELWASKEYTDENYRDIQVGLSNNSYVRLLLLEGGYAMYSNGGLTFKVEDKIFNQLWSQLDRSKDYLLQQNQ